MLEIKTWRDPYDAGFSPTTPTTIRLNEGLTVLVGCNGAGKTTLLKNIEEDCKIQDIPVYQYNNLNQGGSHAVSNAFSNHDYSLMAGLTMSSEGECIKTVFGNLMKKTHTFLKEGYIDDKKHRFADIFRSEDEIANEREKLKETNKRCLLFDALDSGLSVDSVIEVKMILHSFIEEAMKQNLELYIVIAANEYELARHEMCFDVNKGKYIEIADYEAYREFIIESRKRKEKRIEKQEIWYEKKAQKEKEKAKRDIVKYQKRIQQIKDNVEKRKLDNGEKRKLSYFENSTIHDYEAKIKELEKKLSE